VTHSGPANSATWNIHVSSWACHGPGHAWAISWYFSVTSTRDDMHWNTDWAHSQYSFCLRPVWPVACLALTGGPAPCLGLTVGWHHAWDSQWTDNEFYNLLMQLLVHSLYKFLMFYSITSAFLIQVSDVLFNYLSFSALWLVQTGQKIDRHHTKWTSNESDILLIIL
jgi:hypothetical protein